MRKNNSKIFIAAVIAFAISSSSCQLLSGLLGGGGGGGGGIADMLGGLLGGGGSPLGLTETSGNEGLSLGAPSNGVYVKNGYKIVGERLPSNQENSFYATFQSR